MQIANTLIVAVCNSHSFDGDDLQDLCGVTTFYRRHGNCKNGFIVCRRTQRKRRERQRRGEDFWINGCADCAWRIQMTNRMPPRRLTTWCPVCRGFGER